MSRDGKSASTRSAAGGERGGEGKRVWRLDHRSSGRSETAAESEGGRDAKRGGKQTLSIQMVLQ